MSDRVRDALRTANEAVLHLRDEMIREMLAAGVKERDVAERVGLSRQMVNRISHEGAAEAES